MSECYNFTRMFLLLFFVIFLASQPLIAQHPATIKIKADYIKVPVTVFDSRGRLLTNLTQDQFRLLDEGEPRPIENFVLDQTAIHVILLLDVSGSIREELNEFKEAAYEFARSFGREDRIAVMSFSDEVVVLQGWTNRLSDIRRSLDDLERGYRTALYDALYLTVQEKLRKVPGKKVIIVLTDGLDNESLTTYEKLVDTLIEANISLYIVSRTRLVQSKIGKTERVEFLNQVLKNVLDENKDFVEIYFREKEVAITNLAETTGGRVFFPEKLEELKSSYAQVARELKSQYVLTFQPPALSNRRFRKIQVVCTRPIGVLYHRTQYAWRLTTD